MFFPRQGLSLVMVFAVSTAPALAQDSTVQYENLRVLPADISQDALLAAMLDNLRGLGLRRLGGEGCLFCHVGDMETPRTEWDYASDAKNTKRKARIMMEMVRDINDEHLPRLRGRLDTDFEVNCYSCHAGRTDPRPLPTILLEAYDGGGVDSVTTRYRRLRSRYFGGDAYDFRPGILSGVASELVTRGAFEDAVTVASVNREANPDQPAATQTWLQFRLIHVIDTSGVEAALALLDQLAPTVEPAAYTPSILDGLGWGLIRQDREPEGIVLLEGNRARFPDEYVPLESVVFVRDMTGQLDDAMKLLEEWLDAHPDHDRARRLLINLRGG